MYISYEKLLEKFESILLGRGVDPVIAHAAAENFAQTSLDGVYSHGVNRFPRVISYIDKGVIDGKATPECVASFGGFERWDGHMGLGNANARLAMDRACELAHTHGIGVVAIGNTNHWMRPGAYGLDAAEEGCIAVLWTNTVPNMPPWGGKDAKLGNNPVVFAVPHQGGHILLDVAMSMFSYGKLESYARSGKELPVEGGFDKDGNMSKDAAAILETHQPVPIGYWKGSGLSLMLDLIASSLAGGRTTRQVGELPIETELSQVFIAIDINRLSDREAVLENIHRTAMDLKESAPMQEGGEVRYPGEGLLKVREENTRLGIPVEEAIWKGVCAL